MKVKIMMEIDPRELQSGVVVEMWDKKNYGRVKRAWLAEFSEPERKKAGEWYKTFYRWNMVRGHPETITIHPTTYQFLRRLINFFGTI